MTVSYKAISPFASAHLEWEPLVRGWFLIQTSLQPEDRPKEADIKRTGLSFHKKGAVDAAARGNPKNRKCANSFTVELNKAQTFILQRGENLPVDSCLAPRKSPGPSSGLPRPLFPPREISYFSPGCRAFPSSHMGTHRACHRLPQEPGWPTSSHTPQDVSSHFSSAEGPS